MGYTPATSEEAVALMLLSLACWGSWGNATKLWPTRFELFYPDYALGNFLAAVALTLSLGWDELDFNVPPAALLAAAGAAPLYTVGSLLLVAAVELSGMVVAFPVVVGIEMLVGSTLLWVLERSEEPSLLFTGLVLVMAAVAFDALVVSVAAVPSSLSLSTDTCRPGAGATRPAPRVSIAAKCSEDID